MPRWTPFEPYFWSLVDKSDGCWRWIGGQWGGGYGRIRRGNQPQQAHRVAYELTYGPIPENQQVCHHCDNKACVRPDHLFVGSQSDNMLDWTRKGNNQLVNDPSLWKRGDAHWARTERGRQLISKQRKREFASGVRAVIRGTEGRLKGTKICSRDPSS